MKTMMELLISLQRAEKSSVRFARRGHQLTPLEEQYAKRHLDLVREIVPAEVLTRYDQMKKTDSDLLSESPELFAMSVLVATYGSLSPRKRKRLVSHFVARPCPQSAARAQDNTRSTRVRNAP